MMKYILAVGMLTLGAVIFGFADEPAPKGKAGYIKIEARGMLKTGIVAIGGETTGTIVTTPDGTLELDLAKKRDLQELAEKLDGKEVIVTGNLAMRKGLAVKLRLIVSVKDLKAAP